MRRFKMVEVASRKPWGSNRVTDMGKIIGKFVAKNNDSSSKGIRRHGRICVKTVELALIKKKQPFSLFVEKGAK